MRPQRRMRRLAAAAPLLIPVMLSTGPAGEGRSALALPSIDYSSSLRPAAAQQASLRQASLRQSTPATLPRQVQLSAAEASPGDSWRTATQRIEEMPRPMSPLLRRPPEAKEGDVLRNDVGDSLLPYLDPPRGETVQTRERPELEALGIRLGSFILYPELLVDERYNSNIFATPDDEEGDFITQVSPGLLLSSDWNRHELTLGLGADFGFYADHGSEDYIDYFASIDGRLDVTRAASLTAGAAFHHLHEARDSPDDVDGEEPTELDSMVLSVGYLQRLGRFTVRLGGTVESLDFDDVDGVAGIINNDDRDRIEAEGALRAGYRFMPDVEAFLQASYNIRDYDDAVDDAGFTRDSEGFSVAAGVSVDFGGITFGDFFVGYHEQEYDDPAFQTQGGVDAGAKLTWNVTPLTTVIAGVERSVEETTSAGSAGAVATEFSLRADHELLRNMILGLNGRYIMRDYEGIDREDDYYEIGADALYMMNRNLYVSAGYEYRNRDSTLATEDYDQHVAMLRLTLRM